MKPIDLIILAVLAGATLACAPALVTTVGGYLSPEVVFDRPVPEPVVALSIDDGPSPATRCASSRPARPPHPRRHGLLPWQTWHVHNDARSRLLGEVTLFPGPWIMGLFMLLAGRSAFHSLGHRSDRD